MMVIPALLLRTAAGDTVYTWVDAEGVTHFSDMPPATNTAAPGDITTIALPEGYPAAVDPAADYYSVTNQWQRMRAELAATEELALQRERNRVERLRAEQETEQAIATAAAITAAAYSQPAVVYSGYPGISRRPAPHRNHIPAFQPSFNGLPPGIHSEQLLINRRLQHQRKQSGIRTHQQVMQNQQRAGSPDQ